MKNDIRKQNEIVGNVYLGRWTKCLKNQLCDFIKMREIIGEVGKKNP